MRTIGRWVVLLTALLLVAIPATASAQGIQAQGTMKFKVRLGSGEVWFNLDHPERTRADDPTADVRLLQGPTGVVAEARGRTARNSSMLRERPSFEYCRDYPYDAFDRPGGNGRWQCFRTNGGRYARLKVLHSPVDGEEYISFVFVTWVK